MHVQILETPGPAQRVQRWRDEGDCEASAQALARQPGIRDACIELHGPLGAGKTTWTRHLLRALGVGGRIKSPSYAIVEVYEPGGLPIWHCDFYRFSDPREGEEAGLRDLLASPGLKLIEWPDRARPLLPAPDLRLQIELLDDGSRDVLWQAGTALGEGWLR